DHVPCGAAAAEVVQGGQLPGQLVGLVEGGAERAGQPQAAGDRRQRGQHGERVGPADDVQVVDPAPVLAEPQPFGEEEEVEPPALGGPGQVGEGGEVDLAPGGRVGPDRGVVDAGEVRGQPDLLAR